MLRESREKSEHYFVKTSYPHKVKRANIMGYLLTVCQTVSCLLIFFGSPCICLLYPGLKNFKNAEIKAILKLNKLKSPLGK